MNDLRIDAILIRKAKSEIRVSFSANEAEQGPNLTQKKKMVISELETAVKLLKGKEVKYGGGSGFEAGWFDLLVEWPRSNTDSERSAF